MRAKDTTVETITKHGFVSVNGLVPTEDCTFAAHGEVTGTPPDDVWHDLTSWKVTHRATGLAIPAYFPTAATAVEAALMLHEEVDTSGWQRNPDNWVWPIGFDPAAVKDAIFGIIDRVGGYALT